MNTNRLGQSELYVSATGLGCMSIGTDEATGVSLEKISLERECMKSEFEED